MTDPEVANPEDRGLGVYVHWPFCARICPYCDFNVYRDRGVDAGEWRTALAAELHHWAERIPKRPLRSLYFGGGTPSLAPLSVIEAVIETCASLWGFEPDAEITLEANPTDAEEKRFADFARAGVNRLSLGVQSFRDEALAFLGRDHDAASGRRAVETAMATFPRTTFDLIYARPGQSLDDWRDELGEALALGPAHLSLYQLTVERGTAFERAVARGVWRPPEEGLAADLFDLTQETTEAAGVPAYEISNHAKPGAASAHNLIYWRQEDYIGVGPGAHGRFTLNGARVATETARAPADYLARVTETGAGLVVEDALSETAWLEERLTMGLRLVDGCPVTDDLREALEARRARLDALVDEGLIVLEPARIAATRRGRRVLNAVLGYLLT